MTVRALMLGRFQPMHNGHMEVIREVLGMDGVEGLIVAVGSAQESHTPENPFTAGERFEMIEKASEDDGLDGLTIVPVVDLNRYGLYVEYVTGLVPPFGAVVTHSPLTKRLFAEKGLRIIEPGLHDRPLYSSTEIRRRIVANESWQDLVPAAVARVLERIDGAERLRAITRREEAPADAIGA